MPFLDNGRIVSDIIDKVRLKHMLYTTLIAGLILLVLLGGFFALLMASVFGNARDTMQKVLDSQGGGLPVDDSGARCFCFYVSENTARYYPAYSHDVAYYGADIKEIMQTAADVGDGTFEYEDKYFFVASKERAGGVTDYAVYDATADKFMLVRTFMILISLYGVTLVVIALLAYAFSRSTTAPLKEALEKQRDLVTNASHELKTPLAVIFTDLSVMKSDPNSTIADNEKWIESIDGQIARMDGLIKNMLELSKLEQSTLKKDVLDFSEIVSVACLEFEAICFEKHVELLTSINEKINVFGEKSSLERLVTILLDNAVKYSGENGKVGCKLTVDKKIKLTVMNTGQAISEEDAKHVFDRFYRSDGARSNPDGNSFGLGLSIAHATVVAHGGVITCKGVENKGCVFEVILPLPKKKEYSPVSLKNEKSLKLKGLLKKSLFDKSCNNDDDNPFEFEAEEPNDVQSSTENEDKDIKNYN